MYLMLIDDDVTLVKGLKRSFEAWGYRVGVCYDGQTALESIVADTPDIVILDVMLPNKDGFEVLREIRKRLPQLPVIMLTAKAEDIDKVLGLELGADDYVAKPFSVRELEARIKAVLRRTAALPRSQIKKDNLVIDLEGKRVWHKGSELNLTPKEFDVLAFLVKHAGMVMGRGQILQNCWGYDYDGDSRVVDVLVSRLREKIEDDPQKPRIVLTRRGMGYYCE